MSDQKEQEDIVSCLLAFSFKIRDAERRLRILNELGEKTEYPLGEDGEIKAPESLIRPWLMQMAAETAHELLRLHAKADRLDKVLKENV